MKLNYKNISCKPDLTSMKCKDCTFALRTCNTICSCFNYGILTNVKGDIFNENLL